MPKIVVDCNNMAYRAFYTTGVLDLGIVFGFLATILDLSETLESNQFIFCWDSNHSYRKEVYPKYKTRPDKTEEEQIKLEEAKIQFKMLRKEVLPELGFTNVFVCPGYEADDLMAFVVKQFPDEYVIVSGDEDLYQVLSEDVSIYQPIPKKLVTKESFESDYGISSSEWSKVKSLAGCTSDTVTGIQGVGEKTAIKYLTGNLTKGKVFDRIEEQKDGMVSTNLPIVSLPYKGDRPISISGINIDKLYRSDFMSSFTHLEMRSFLKDNSFDEWVEALDLHRTKRTMTAT
jgi:DNA polymerase I